MSVITRTVITIIKQPFRSVTMSLFSTASSKQINIGLMILRLVVGAIFVAHGGQKLFQFGFDGVTGAFGRMGIPMPGVLGPFVALVEFFGGLALITGLLTRLAAVALVVDMLVAILVVHMKNGFFAPTGIEFPLMLLGSAALITIAGAGEWSLDRLIANRGKRPADAVSDRRLHRAA
jgi:putative oxidoreductase